MQVEDTAYVILKEVEGVNDVSLLKLLKLLWKKNIHVEDTTGAKASDAAEIASTSMISNLISKTILNSFNP